MIHLFRDATFAQDVLQSSVPVVVDFWAEWCGPCRMMGPLTEELADEMDESQVKIGKMNVDENPAVPGQYGVMSIPTFLIFKKGQVVDQIVGSMPKEALKERISKQL